MNRQYGISKFRIIGAAVLIYSLLAAIGYPALAQSNLPAFRDVSESAGIQFNRISDEKTIGQAWGDVNNDGWLDLYVTDDGGGNSLYHNNGDGTFQISPLAEHVALPNVESAGATFIDYDNDGWLDLYVLNWGANTLFHNEAGERFVDVTKQAGVAGDHNSKSATWGDYDQDGFTDLYVVNWACYPKCGRPVAGDSDRLYHNNGDGTFSNVTRLLGGKTGGAGFAASFTDYDNDGDPDIYLVNDEFINPIGNVLWRNDGADGDKWRFTEISAEAGANQQLMGMGLATSDYDNDGDLDFYFSNAGPMALLQNGGNGAFVDVAKNAGVELATAIGWGAIFLDYNNDGWQDLYIALSEGTDGEAVANPLLHNQGDGSFVAVENSGAENAGKSLGVAYADYDNDGWVDFVLGNYDEGYKLFHNEGGVNSDNSWLTMTLEGGGGINRDAIGSRVYLTDSAGNQQMQEIICGGSLGAGNAMSLYFGLGDEDSANIEIVWANGVRQAFEAVPANQAVRLPYPVDEATEERQKIALYGESGWESWQIALGLGVLLLAGIFGLALMLKDKRLNNSSINQ